MESQLTFLDCPGYLDEEGLARCGLPAEVLRRFVMESTGGALDSVVIRCLAGHHFNAPIEFLSLESKPVTRGDAEMHSRQPQPEDNVCQHQPRCSDALAPDRTAERMAVGQEVRPGKRPTIGSLTIGMPGWSTRRE